MLHVVPQLGMGPEPPAVETRHLNHWWVVVFTQLGLTLFDPMDCSPLGSSVHGILQARILEWVTISFSGGSSWPRDRTWVSFTAGRFFTFWATREAPSIWSKLMQNRNLVFYLLRGQIFVFFKKNWSAFDCCCCCWVTNSHLTVFDSMDCM